MRIYTKTGDQGKTSLIYGERVDKNDLRVEAYGTCDEANAVIGVALSTIDQGISWSISERKVFLLLMKEIQTLLFHVGSELSTPKGKEVPWKINEKHIDNIEEAIDNWEKEIPPLTQFILPNGHQTSAMLHHARTIVRRAERLVVGLKDEINPLVLVFLNRLSDLLFVSARYVNKFSAFEEETFEIN
ncbi:cob(I)yrinic acid a,c-diamide adenosyltransferase [Amphibacillus sp. MSJ-3]|uniref:cob(I)yrinic acid a,c-diamide adenosyltransferase n=1 Tax=Amphibacillus sp. MSJ-3 TaxID=2841505 RepID=UPI001C0F28EE|nr:cob(I)yrinic acid a,c-diamide adenosyltransferase [Amphibacillus sp. MSJ-3]MBU5595642.1 cob(I)yrinic acid a,c-diamide adenosyltransferase [Amphibacillus sp. MSJ-3]